MGGRVGSSTRHTMYSPDLLRGLFRISVASALPFTSFLPRFTCSSAFSVLLLLPSHRRFTDECVSAVFRKLWLIDRPHSSNPSFFVALRHWVRANQRSPLSWTPRYQPGNLYNARANARLAEAATKVNILWF
jgi:hypothetical protein